MEASCKNWLFHFLLDAYHLILWGHRLMKVQMSLVQFRYIYNCHGSYIALDIIHLEFEVMGDKTGKFAMKKLCC